MSRFFFAFGYEDPEDVRVNAAYGDDAESSTSIWIEAETDDQAIDWGRTIAERFVVWLFERAGERPYSWIENRYGHAIEPGETSYVAERDQCVSVGQMPDFERMERER